MKTISTILAIAAFSILASNSFFTNSGTSHSSSHSAMSIHGHH